MSPSLESTCGPGVENVASRNVSKMSARPEVEARTVGAIPLLDEGTGIYGISSYRDTNPTLVRTLIDSIQAVLDD